MALSGIQPAIFGAGLIIVALGIQVKRTLSETAEGVNETLSKAPEPNIIPLPDGDYMAEGWHSNESFLTALRKFMLEKEGFTQAETDWFISVAALTREHRAVKNLFGEHYFLPTEANDTEGFPVTTGRIL